MDGLEKMPLQVEKLFYDLQNRIMMDVVRRIKKTGGITSTADYQLNKVQILGGTTEFIEDEIQRLTGMTDAEIWKLYDDVVDQGYTRQRSIYEQVNSNFVPYEENKMLQARTYAVVKQTRGEIKNITRSLGMTVNMGGKAVFTPLAEYYQKYLDRACLDIATGSFSYNTVLRRVVKEMAASGIRSVDYASGWSNRVPVAARRAVMTGVHQLSAQINEQVAKDLKTNHYEVTWHSGARPDHWWGGMVFSYDDLRRVCNLGDVTGLCGANCYHSYYAFIPGVSTRTYTDTQLEEMNAREKEKHTYQGKQYNAYEATQRQRQLETRMRAQRSKIKLLKEGKVDPDEIMAAQTRYLSTLHEYQGFSKSMKLPEQMERVYMDGLGRVIGGKNGLETTIVNAKSVVKSSDYAILRVSTGAMASPRRPRDDIERSKIINEAITARRPFYAENLRRAYDSYGIKPQDGYYDVLIHGAPTFVEYEGKYVLDAETLYYIISGRSDYNWDNIRLLSCSTGKADKNGNCLAQDLADLLGVDVYAPEDILNINSNGTLTVGKKHNKGFKCFHPRR